MYSQRVRELLNELPGRGRLPEPTHSARATNPVCGDVVEFDLGLRDGLISECAFRAEGCPAALASAAGLRAMILGRPISELGAISPEDLIESLGGLPSHKRHGAEVAVEALRNTIAGLSW